MDKLHTKRILATAFVVFMLIFICVNLIIFSYAFWLGFQAQGAPEPEKISAFAARFTPLISIVSSSIFTFLASIWITRKVNDKIVSHCVYMATCTAVFLIIYGILFSETIWHNILAGACVILAGFLGAKTGIKINNKAADLQNM